MPSVCRGITSSKTTKIEEAGVMTPEEALAGQHTIAQRPGPQYLVTDAEGKFGRLIDISQHLIGPRMNIQSIIAQGYWRPSTFTIKPEWVKRYHVIDKDTEPEEKARLAEMDATYKTFQASGADLASVQPAQIQSQAPPEVAIPPSVPVPPAPPGAAMSDIQQGSTAIITQEIFDDYLKRVAFSKGERVVVRRVFPNERPQYKYSVVSKLGERWRLSDDDLAAIQPPQQTDPLQPPPQAPVPKKSSEPAKGAKRLIRFELPRNPTDAQIAEFCENIQAIAKKHDDDANQAGRDEVEG